jgi:riboflavin kinase / FMN adenylyltransferase
MHKICLNHFKNPPKALAIGVFDGLHLGHLDIIGALKKHDISSVLSFYPHPRPKTKLILSFSERLRRLKDLGIHQVFMITKKDAVFGMSTKDFIKKVLIDELSVQNVIVGEDFRLGKNRDTNALAFQELCSKENINVVIIKDLKIDDKKISSTTIREFLEKGRVLELKEQLGRSYSISGIVAKGKGIGGKLGFKTANIYPSKKMVIPCNGVYKTSTNIDEKEYKSVTFVGGQDRTVIETHVPNFDSNIYYKRISVSFIKRMRDIKKFKSTSELVLAIKEDIKNSV